MIQLIIKGETLLRIRDIILMVFRVPAL
jgi:hypothetical protein